MTDSVFIPNSNYPEWDRDMFALAHSSVFGTPDAVTGRHILTSTYRAESGRLSIKRGMSLGMSLDESMNTYSAMVETIKS